MVFVRMSPCTTAAILRDKKQIWFRYSTLTPIELCMITTLVSRVLHPLKSPVSPSLCSRSFSRSLPSLNDGGPTGSRKLFADAALEEAEEHANNNSSQHKSHLQFLENQYTNWDGEERMEDAVLRMLVDKYKPLRGGTIRTAEEKLKQTPPSVRLETTSTNVAEARQSDWANHTILPAIEGHKPWLTTYKVPSHAATSIRTGRFPPPASTRSSGASSVDDRTRRKEIELKKREKVAGRLTKAKESTLDYRLGINRADAPKRIRSNPISLRGWTSLIEDKIEVCRSPDIPLT
jgi:DnaJ family protein C protein 28